MAAAAGSISAGSPPLVDDDATASPAAAAIARALQDACDRLAADGRQHDTKPCGYDKLHELAPSIERWLPERLRLTALDVPLAWLARTVCSAVFDMVDAPAAPAATCSQLQDMPPADFGAHINHRFALMQTLARALKFASTYYYVWALCSDDPVTRNTAAAELKRDVARVERKQRTPQLIVVLCCAVRSCGPLMTEFVRHVSNTWRFQFLLLPAKRQNPNERHTDHIVWLLECEAGTGRQLNLHLALSLFNREAARRRRAHPAQPIDITGDEAVAMHTNVRFLPDDARRFVERCFHPADEATVRQQKRAPSDLLDTLAMLLFGQLLPYT